jgi:alanyl-tRNA synthetase
VTRLYYADSYLTSFDSTVVETSTVDGHPAVVLESSTFYPSSGGQPFDTGTLGERRVIDVRVRETDGAVLHLLDGALAAGPVQGAIDWARRRDHMEQHTGQHVLSQAFIRVAEANTIGFHLGAEYVSIDLDVTDLDDTARREAFAMANDVVARDLPVMAWFPTPDELATIPLRKTPEVDGALRIVAIGEFDTTACGGTHVARTGEIGLIHWLKTERLKRGTRIAFLAGDRARRDYDQKQEIVAGLSAALTCAAGELPEAVARLQQDLTVARRELSRHHEEALDREAQSLAAEAVTRGAVRVLRRAWEGRPADELRALVLRLTGPHEVVALLGASGEKSQLVLGRPESVALDLKAGLNAALAALGGGRGGGARIVQGGGGPADLATVDAALDAALGTIPT